MKMPVDIKPYNNPEFGRIIIASDWNGDIDEAKEVIIEVCSRWNQEENSRVNCLITCGGFLKFDWPDNLPDIVNLIFILSPHT
jgi:hypothetical protein